AVVEGIGAGPQDALAILRVHGFDPALADHLFRRVAKRRQPRGCLDHVARRGVGHPNAARGRFSQRAVARRAYFQRTVRLVKLRDIVRDGGYAADLPLSIADWRVADDYVDLAAILVQPARLEPGDDFAPAQLLLHG